MRKGRWSNTKYKKEEVRHVPFQPKYPPSPEQEKIFETFLQGNGNLHVEAKAGTGKTTTIVWMASMYKYPHHLGYLAFNKSIATEVMPKMPEGSTVKTGHAFGYKSLNDKFGRLQLEEDKIKNIIKEICPWLDPDNEDEDEDEGFGGKYGQLVNAANIVNMLRLNLLEPDDNYGIGRVCKKYGLDLDEQFVPKIPKVFEESKKLIEKSCIDFIDMLWGPIVFDLRLAKIPILFVDEAQDLSPLMQEYCFRLMGERIITVGDKNQSIYGFAGADVNSIPNLIKKFEPVELPLNTCYRCGKKIIAEAQKIVPEIQAHESNIEGEVVVQDRKTPFDFNELPDGSMALCRRNAGLVKPCFDLIKRGRRAVIKGKDIGESLAKMSKTFKADTIPDYVKEVEKHRDKRMSILLKRKNTMSQREQLNDLCDVLCAFAEQADSPSQIPDKIKSIFSDEKSGVTFSSMHKAKGLESDVVALIDADNLRIHNDKMTSDQLQQEANLEYVAKTRPKQKLILTYKSQ